MVQMGFRDDGLFGDEVTSPSEVVAYETFVLGNSDIPHSIMKWHAAKLSEEERVALTRICNPSAPEHGCDRADMALLDSALEKVLAGRDFCKWLCATPSDVVSSYMEPFYDAAERVAESVCSAYVIPADAVALTELAFAEGTLWAWHASPENVVPVWEMPMRDALGHVQATARRGGRL